MVRVDYSFRIGWFDLLVVQRTLKSLLQHHNLKASILQCSAFFMVQFSLLYRAAAPQHWDPGPRAPGPGPRPPPRTVGLGHGRLRHLGSGSASRGAPLRLRRAGGREAGESAAPRWGTRGAGERRREGPAVPKATAGPQLLRPRRTAGSAQAHGLAPPVWTPRGGAE